MVDVSAIVMGVKDILYEIFSYVNPEDLLNCSLVSKKWCTVANNNEIWYNVVKNYILAYTKDKEANIFFWFNYFSIGNNYKNGYLYLINRKYNPLYKIAAKDFIFVPQNDTSIQRVDPATRIMFIGYYYIMLILIILPTLLLFIIFDVFNYGLHFICRKKRKYVFADLVILNYS